MSATPEAPCTTRLVTDTETTWLRWLVRSTRDILFVHPVEDSLPNISPLFAGLTFGFRDEFHLLFTSYPSTQHTRYIDSKPSARAPYDSNQRLIGGAALELVNTASTEIALRMYGEAFAVPDTELAQGRIALNAIRQLKGVPLKDFLPKSHEDPGERLYAVKIHYADTQGECWSQAGNHVGEGHPIVNLEQLRGFEAMPGLAPGQPSPLTTPELYAHLQHSA